MIVTNINSPELEAYAKAHPLFARAIEAVRKYLSEELPDGSRAVDMGEELYANVFTYETKSEADSCFESHKRYVDLQAVLEGEEIIGFESADKLTVTSEYNAEGDCTLYAMNREYDRIRLARGELAVIFPEEPHAPGMSVGDRPARVRKMVVKVLY